MRPDQIKALVSQWINSELERTEQAKAESGTNELEEAEDYKDVYGDLLEEADEARLMNQQWKVEDLDLELVTRHGLQMESDSPEFGRLCHELLKGCVELYREEIRRMDGEYKEESKSAYAEGKPLIVSQPFSVVVKAYMKEFSNRQPRTQSQIEAGFHRFIKVMGGDKRVGDITKTDCRAYKEAMVGERELGAASVNKYLHSLEHCLTWAQAQGFLSEDHRNPAQGLRIAKSVVRSQARKVIPFTDEELTTIFCSEKFQIWKGTHPEYYFGLLALLITAARREEVYQLDKADVKKDPKTGIWCFHFIDGGEEDKEKTVKNVGSRRVVPLPDLLIELGFLRYVESIDHKRVFPQLEHKGNGYGDVPGKAWARLVKRLKVGSKGKVLHSLRHGGITKLAEHGVPDAHATALTGHTGGRTDVHFKDYTHTGAFSLEKLKKSIDVLGEAYREVLRGLR
ncbi:MAG: putative Phageintegrase domain-containing protein [Nitrospira sp.]|nr:MAG: putative Phageintegrase domain-containing protein [Nitrospira sp.]